MIFPAKRVVALAFVLLPLLAAAQSAPNVTVELVKIDPAAAYVVPLNAQVHGRIRYTTDAPVRLVIVPYRDGRPVEGFSNSGSPEYAAGSGETIAWFAFREPQVIDEVRAVANDYFGTVYAEAGLEKSLEWRAGAPAVPAAAWVAALKQAPKNLAPPPPPDPLSDALWGGLTQLMFLSVPLSVVLQIYALRRFEGTPRRLARVSAFLMGALWLFVLVTAVGGSNLSPIWLVFTGPLFVAFLLLLLFASRRRRPAPVSPA